MQYFVRCYPRAVYYFDISERIDSPIDIFFHIVPSGYFPEQEIFFSECVGPEICTRRYLAEQSEHPCESGGKPQTTCTENSRPRL